MSNIEIRTYDVWGNEEDGFEINDVYHYGTYDKIVFNSAVDVLRFLNEHYFAKPQTLNNLNIDMTQEGVVYVKSAKTGEPLCQIIEDAE